MSTIDRLEAVAARLEAVAASFGGAKAAAGSHETKGPAPSVAAFDQFFQTSVQPFINAASKFPETKKIGTDTEAALKLVRNCVLASTQCKKPSDAVFGKFLEPLSKIISSQNPDNRSPFFNQQKSFAEAIAFVGWVMSPMPKPVVLDTLEAADFYLIKILTLAKTKTGDEQTNLRAFVDTLKAMIKAQADYVVEYFKTGLEWNFKGVDLASWNPDSAPAAPSAPEAPGAPPAPADLPSAPVSTGKPAGGGMGAVFDSINQGNVTGGLKKVTKEMKSKNQTDKPVLQPKAKAPAPSAAKPAAAAPKAEPKLHLNKGTWFVENYESDISIPEVEVKQNVYILKARNCTITVPDKCKSIQIDGAFRVNLVFKSVVSLCEIFNSTRSHIHCLDTVPSVAIDKCSGISVHLSAAGVVVPPTIITSNVSELNLVVPGATPEDDPVEIPLPEQYVTTLVKGKLETVPMAHSGA